MERNPHWNETINEDITITDLPPWSPQQEWGDVGGGGEFTGWKSQADPPSYKSDWQDYPADEFTGIQSNVPSGGGFLRNIYEKFGGTKPGLWSGLFGGGFDTPYHHKQWQQDQDLLQQQKIDSFLEFENQNRNRFNPEPGPWNEFNPRSRYGTLGEADWGEDLLAKIYQSGNPGMINKGSKWNFMPGGDPLWDEVSPQGEAINTVLEMPIIQQMITEGGFNYEDFMGAIPEWLRRELPRDAFQSKSDFMKQQPITVI